MKYALIYVDDYGHPQVTTGSIASINDSLLDGEVDMYNHPKLYSVENNALVEVEDASFNTVLRVTLA